MPLEDVQSLLSVDSIGLADLPEESIPEDDLDENGALDPRVQIELERLNEATELINKCEAQLDEARAAGRAAFIDMTRTLNDLAEKLGKCIAKARPYYEARVELKKAQTELQQAALLYEKANASLKASKEIVKLTEEGLTRQGGKLDETFQEMLNYATRKVAQCEETIRLRQRDHWQASKVCAETEIKVRLLEKKFKSSIVKSQSYYELRSQMNHFVEKEKLRVHQLEQAIIQAKQAYSEGLTNLEGISEQIHRQRRLKDSMIQRDSGCGTISDSASIQSANLGDGILEEASHDSPHGLPSTPPTSKQQDMIEAFHGIFCAQEPHVPLSQTNLSEVRRPSVLGLPSATSYPLLTALEKELSRLQVEQAQPKKRPLITVTSVDSAVDSGSECGDFDAPSDATITGLDLAQF